MESLESKLDRLNPVQRKEVESFVDFLLSREGGVPVTMGAAQVPPVQYAVPPPMILHEPSTITESSHPADQLSYQQVPAMDHDEEAIQEIAVGGSDWVTKDFLDYGNFEENSRPALSSTPSPAAEAVQRIKKKLGDKKQPEPGKHILEWID